MRLVSAYAPPTFLKPCLVISTAFHGTCRETALRFVRALNHDHALALAFGGGGDQAPPSTDWVIIQQHEAVEQAVQYHVDLARPFINGGSNEEWQEGWEPYLKLYEAYYPADLRGALA